MRVARQVAGTGPAAAGVIVGQVGVRAGSRLPAAALAAVNACIRSITSRLVPLLPDGVLQLRARAAWSTVAVSAATVPAAPGAVVTREPTQRWR